MVQPQDEALQFRKTIEVPCKTLSSESGKALKALATAMKTMSDPSPSSQVHLNAAKSAINDLKNSLKSAATISQIITTDIDRSSSTNLLAIIPDATVASILIEIVKSVEDLCESVAELSLKAHFKKVTEKLPQLLHKGTIKPFVEAEEEELSSDHVVITVRETEKNEDSLQKKEPNCCK